MVTPDFFSYLYISQAEEEYNKVPKERAGVWVEHEAMVKNMALSLYMICSLLIPRQEGFY